MALNIDMRHPRIFVDQEPASFRAGHHGGHLEVVRGTAYVTIEGDPEDHLLTQGQELSFAPHRLVVVQGLPEAIVAA